jgi:capsular polysaccharide biosynthesis protein
MSTIASDPGAERDVDLARWKAALGRRWWIVAVGVVAGIVVGGLYSLSGGSVYEASVLLAPSQAFSPNGSPVLSYQSSPRNINVLVTNPGTLARVVAAVAKNDHLHIALDQLRTGVSTASLSTGLGTSTASRGSQLIQITVRLPKAAETAAAANALGAEIATESTSQYVTQSIATLQADLAGNQQHLKNIQQQINAYSQVLKTQQLDPFNKLILVTQLGNAELQEGNLNDKIVDETQEVTLTESIEKASIVGAAPVAVKTTARSRRNSILVGLLIGLIIGGIAAIVADTRMARARR